MAWESVRVLDSDFPVGYTENDYYFTGNRSAAQSGSQGGFSDITFVLSFSLRDYSGSAGDSYFYNQPAGDYYLVGDSNAGIFVRKTGNAQSNSGTITVKASYNGQADSGSTMPENLSAATAVRSGYSGLYMQFSIICGINEETHKGTIFTYRKWNGWIGSNSDYLIKYCDYDRYTNSEVAYNLIKGIMPVLGITSNGGGATHIAKVTGQLKDLSSNLSDILMVSGGGGGGYLTGVPGWDGHEIDILWSGENNKMTAQRANDILTFKLYTSGTEIYSFNSPVADPSNINLSFASDSENQVARPAFVYYDGSSSYSYNQEAPTDEEMADIYTWLRNTPVDPVPSEYDYIKRAGTYNVKIIDANYGEHYYDLTEVPFIWNMNQLNNPFNKNLPFTLFYPGEQFYNWYYSTVTSIRFYDTATINLTKESNDSYTASYTGFNYKQGISLNNGYNCVNSHGWHFESEIGDYLYVSDWSEQTQPATMTTSFNNLSEALIYIEQHFRHVNVYVDGVCWVRAS